MSGRQIENAILLVATAGMVVWLLLVIGEWVYNLIRRKS